MTGIKMWRKILSIILVLCLIPNLCWAGINFDKVDDVVNCGTSDTLFTENGAITISAWINPTDLGENSSGRIVDRSGSTSGPEIQLAGTATLRFDANGTTVLVRKSSNNVITTETWQHILMTWDGSTTASNVHIYVNGTETSYQTTTNGASLTDNSGQSLLIGNDSSNARTFNGIITEVAIWNMVLSAPQIALLASSKVKRIPLQLSDPDADGVQELVGYWTMDEGVDEKSADLDTARDLSGNGNDGNPDNGANNTGLTWKAEEVLSYPDEFAQ